MPKKGDNTDISLTNLAEDVREANALAHLCFLSVRPTHDEDAAANALMRGLDILEIELTAIAEAINRTREEYLNA